MAIQPGEMAGGQRAPSAPSTGAGALWDSGGVTYEWGGSGWNPRGGGAGSGGGSDYETLARQQMKLSQEANAPAVQSLQSQIPTIQQSFQQQGNYLKSQVDPLNKRYENLISSIKGQGQEEINRTSTATSSELGRRGISSESGLYGQTVNQALNPINQRIAGNLSNVGTEQEQAIAALQNQIAQNPIQQTQAEQQVLAAIAQLQSGGASQGIQNALTQYGQQQQAQQQSAALALQKQQSDIENRIKEAQLGFAQQQQPLELQKLQAEIAKLQQSGQPEPTNPYLAQIAAIMGGGGQTQQTQSTNKVYPSNFVGPLPAGATKQQTSRYSIVG